MVQSNLDNIIDSGSNANGNYVKFADGTMICKGVLSIAPFNVSTANGALFESARFTVTFPATFYDCPGVSVSNYGGTGEALFMYSHGGVNTGFFYVKAINTGSTTGRNENLTWLAIGRWKA